MSSNACSLVEYFGRQEVNSCGYCKTSKGHSDYGMWLHFLTVMEYQNLIDRGWRRSGSYGYKPVMKGACCALYTIRCGALDLRLTKSQKKLIKRFNRFIVYGERRKWRSGNDGARGKEETCPESVEPSKTDLRLERIDIEEPKPSCSAPKPTITTPETSTSQHIVQRQRDNSNASKPNSKSQNKKKTLRIENAKKRVMGKGKTEEEAIEILKSKKKMPSAKTVEDFLTECEKPNVKHKLEMKLVQSSPSNEEFEKTFETEYEVYRKYQVVIHKDNPSECTAKQFRRFLVTSPLRPESLNDINAPVQSFGSYHHQYWLDGKLIAVGVIDVLPYCVSSVYFFYDPDYSDLALGTYSSMKELQLARELHKFAPSVQYYYMGYYIHTCPKMRYKVRISPSYLLCPETYTFQPVSRCLEKINMYGFCRLHPDIEAKDECDVDTTDQVLVLVGHSLMLYQAYHFRFNSTDQIEVKEFAKAVGKRCMGTLLLLRTP